MASGHGEDLPRALAGRDSALPVVLLAHHPKSLARAVAAGVDLQLSGHTHGGQLLPLGWLARLFEPHVAGLARFGTTWLYVSRGHRVLGPAAAHRHVLRDRRDHARVTASVPAMISDAPASVPNEGASPNTSSCHTIAKQIWR